MDSGIEPALSSKPHAIQQHFEITVLSEIGTLPCTAKLPQRDLLEKSAGESPNAGTR
jgi:hypothetical protein